MAEHTNITIANDMQVYFCCDVAYWQILLQKSVETGREP